jgi:hypothetical protein
LGWSAQAEQHAIEQYVGKINRYLQLAGLSAETAANGATAQSAGGAN